MVDAEPKGVDVSWSIHLLSNLTTSGQIATNLSVNIHGPQSIHPNDFDDPLTITIARCTQEMSNSCAIVMKLMRMLPRGLTLSILRPEI